MRRPLAMLLAASMALTAGAAFTPAAAAMPAMPQAFSLDGSDFVVKVQDRARDRWRPRYRRGGDRDTYWRGGHRRYGHRHYGHRHYGRYYPRYYGGYYPRYYRYGYYDDYYGPAVAAGIIGLAAGAILGSQPYRYYNGGYGGDDWAAACARKYRSFDWSSGTYLGYDGYRHRCRLP